MVPIWCHMFYFISLHFTTFHFHNSLKNKRQTEFYFYLALCFADWTGLEPATPCVTGMYSNQLNYQSIHCFLLKRRKDRYTFIMSKYFAINYFLFFLWSYFYLSSFIWLTLQLRICLNFYHLAPTDKFYFCRRYIFRRTASSYA